MNMKNKIFMLMLVLVIGVLAACGAKDDKASDKNQMQAKAQKKSKY